MINTGINQILVRQLKENSLEIVETTNEVSLVNNVVTDLIASVEEKRVNKKINLILDFILLGVLLSRHSDLSIIVETIVKLEQGKEINNR